MALREQMEAPYRMADREELMGIRMLELKVEWVRGL